MILFVGSIVLLITLAIWGWWCHLSERSKLWNKVPGPHQQPLIGSWHFMMWVVPKSKWVQMSYEWMYEYADMYRIWVLGFCSLHICNADYAETLLSDPKYTYKGIAYWVLQPWLGTGLLTSSGKKWFKHRKLLTPTFHFKILDTFVETFNRNSLILVEAVREEAIANKDKLNLYPYITRCALDIICESAMGTKLNAQNDRGATPYVQAVYNVTQTTVARFLNTFLWPPFIFYIVPIGRRYNKDIKLLHEFTENVIKKRYIQRQQQSTEGIIKEEDDVGRKQKKAFLDLLLDANANEEQKLTVEEIREEVDTFMFEGHDTTTAAIFWTIFMLGHHPEIQEEVYQELKAILPDDRSPTMADLNEMKCLERVMKETLRLFPSVPFILRWLKEDAQLGEYRIPKWTICFIHIINIHKNEKYWPDPEKFDPDRFLPDNVQKRHPFAYVPFSAGPRNCIGQRFALNEEKVILSHLIRNFKFESITKREDLRFLIELILRPQDGIKIKVVPRHRS